MASENSIKPLLTVFKIATAIKVKLHKIDYKP
jgi:hypothetical protein